MESLAYLMLEWANAIVIWLYWPVQEDMKTCSSCGKCGVLGTSAYPIVAFGLITAYDDISWRVSTILQNWLKPWLSIYFGQFAIFPLYVLYICLTSFWQKVYNSYFDDTDVTVLSKHAKFKLMMHKGVKGANEAFLSPKIIQKQEKWQY